MLAVNPNAEVVEGDRGYSSVTTVPERLDGIVLVTPGGCAAGRARRPRATDVPRVWLHHGIGPGWFSEKVVAYCHEHGINVIPAGCPRMFGETADGGHKYRRAMLRITGKLTGAV